MAAAGRWENVRTCRKYVDEAMAELSHFQVTQLAKLDAGANMLDDLL